MTRRRVINADSLRWILDCKITAPCIITRLPSHAFLRTGGDEAKWKKRFAKLHARLQEISTGPVLFVEGDASDILASIAQACVVARTVDAKYILDPMCGDGLILAVADRLGIDNVGVEGNAALYDVAKHLEVRF